MDETSKANDRRAEIAMRNRRRMLEARERKLSMAVFGLMAYSALANVASGILLLVLGKPSLAASFGLVLGALYAFGAYRIWFKDDTRWWPVAVPASLSIVVLALAWFGGAHRPIPLLLNIALFILVPIRGRVVAAVPKAFRADASGTA
ncbi:hypothetical protein [Frateuria defendens]|uniref:hypothetical protein n=1 Tax=Frateuria defendens TaxID=2219559 RepID=UPI0012939645|nr:hypothetical protein [Frateuria defendens]